MDKMIAHIQLGTLSVMLWYDQESYMATSSNEQENYFKQGVV